MPFTASHVAAVLPLRRTKLDFAALAIGAMSPDLSYVLELFGPQVQAHSLVGIFVFCLPVSLVLYVAWRAYAARAWVALCPWMQDERRAWWSVLAGILIGAATHVVWDGFTHRTGFAVTALAPWLDTPVYRALQHVSTVAGAACVIVAVRRTMAARGVRFVSAPRTLAWLVGAGAAATAIIAAFATPAATSLVRIAFAGLGAAVVVALGYPIVARGD